MALELIMVSDKEPQKNGWYLVQNLNRESGYMIAQYMGDHEWKKQGSGSHEPTTYFPWYWDNPLINVQSD